MCCSPNWKLQCGWYSSSSPVKRRDRTLYLGTNYVCRLASADLARESATFAHCKLVIILCMAIRSVFNASKKNYPQLRDLQAAVLAIVDKYTHVSFSRNCQLVRADVADFVLDYGKVWSWQNKPTFYQQLR